MTDIHVAPATSLRGELHLPGDKSVAHRALLLALVSDEPVTLEGVPPGSDVAATLAAVQALGARVEELGPGRITVHGRGMRGVAEPADGLPLDAANSGTLARLLCGLLAGQDGRRFTIVGDASLSRRPMARVATPLSALGGQVTAAQGGLLPLVVEGVAHLRGGTVTLPAASAQVQAALLLAGLYADAPLTVVEPSEMRDHTERILRRAGASVQRTGRSVTVQPADRLQLPDTAIGADPSSAAFLVAGATLLRGSVLRLPQVLDQPGRRGFLDQLEQMGGRVGASARATLDGEPVADLEIQHATLNRAWIEETDVARMIDELPVMGLIAHFCRGESVVRNAGELRMKESDRISLLVTALRGIGVAIEERYDGFSVRGSKTRPSGGRIDAAGDHRLAMLGGIAGLVSRHGVTVENAECVDVSFPGFFEAIEQLAVR